MYICGIVKKSGENVKDSKKIKLSEVTELSNVAECYEALTKDKLFYVENDDFFTIYSDEDSRETDEKQTRNAAGRLCSKIASLSMLIEMEIEEKEEPMDVQKIIERKFLDKVSTQIILEKFAKTIKLSSIKLVGKSSIKRGAKG